MRETESLSISAPLPPVPKQVANAGKWYEHQEACVVLLVAFDEWARVTGPDLIVAEAEREPREKVRREVKDAPHASTRRRQRYLQ